VVIHVEASRKLVKERDESHLEVPEINYDRTYRLYYSYHGEISGQSRHDGDLHHKRGRKWRGGRRPLFIFTLRIHNLYINLTLTPKRVVVR
jgi:hypothetical protein